LYQVLSYQGQNAIVDWTDFDALRDVEVAVAFGTGFFTDFENYRTFLDRIGRADRFAIAARNTFFSNYI
jgi:hypothetical protein